MSHDENDAYFRQLMIETKSAIIQIIRQYGGMAPQGAFLEKLDELIDDDPGLYEMARESHEDAFLFVFGALIQLMSEGVIGFDETGNFYFLILHDGDGS